MQDRPQSRAKSRPENTNLPIILLDLNFTLVANSNVKKTPFTEQIRGETYRQWMVEVLQPYRVILVTARPAKYRAATLESIFAKTGWKPAAAYFNEIRQAPPLTKSHSLNLIREAEGEKHFVAIESNPATAIMYRARCVQVIMTRDVLSPELLRERLQEFHSQEFHSQEFHSQEFHS